MSNGSAGSQQQDPFSMQPTPLPLEDIIGMPPSDDESRGDQDMNIHITPPHTPVFSGRSRALAPGRHSATGVHTPAPGHSSSHNRSVSVPPSEHRSLAPKPPLSQTQTPNPSRQYKPLPSTRIAFQPFQLPTTIAPSQIQARAPPLAPHQIPLPPPNYPTHPGPADFYHVPYLDLHYASTISNNPTLDLAGDPFYGTKFQGNAQALDLAETLSQVHHHPHHPKLSCIAPSQIQLVPPLGLGGHGAEGVPIAGPSRAQHHRGQSAASISPQDLLLRKGSDNKRKRASWDGGPG